METTLPMATFTSTLPDDLLKKLAEKAGKLSLPKNKLIENALRLYLEHLEKAEYINSYRQAGLIAISWSWQKKEWKITSANSKNEARRDMECQPHPTKGSEQAGFRPVVIVSGNLLNTHLPVVITIPLTSKIKNYKGNPVLQPSATKRTESLFRDVGLSYPDDLERPAKRKDRDDPRGRTFACLKNAKRYSSVLEVQFRCAI